MGRINSLCYSLDGNYLLSADDKGKMVLYSSTRKLLHSWQLPGAVYRAVFLVRTRGAAAIARVHPKTAGPANCRHSLPA